MKTKKNRTLQRCGLAVMALVMALVAGAISAANISNLNGQSCGEATGTWHFVNNQARVNFRGQIIATWDSGDSCSVLASTVNKSNQHFYCTASGALSSAMTNLPGKLVLSDFECGEPPKPPPCEKDCEPPK